MSYRTGTYTAPTDNNPNRHVSLYFLRDVLKPALLAAGYTQVQDLAHSNGNTLRVAVFSTPAGTPAPFLMVTTGHEAGTVLQDGMYLSWMTKPYDAATRTFSGLSVDATQSARAFNADGTFNFSLSVDQASDSSALSYLSPMNAGGFQYWLSITAKTLVLGIRAASTEVSAMFCEVTPVTASSQVPDGERWARSVYYYSQPVWLCPSEPKVTAAGSLNGYAGSTAVVQSVYRDAFTETRILVPTQIRANRLDGARGTITFPHIVGSNFNGGDTITDANNKVYVLLRASSQPTFFGIDTSA
jgi:hypothetical protein